MGLSPKEKPTKETKTNPGRLRRETITFLLFGGVPRICSHQQVDDHRKREYHTAEHTTIKVG